MVKKRFGSFTAGLLLASIPAFPGVNYNRSSHDLRYAQELYDHGRYSTSLAVLDLHASDGASLFLIGRDYYMLTSYRKASEYLKKATVAAPDNSDYVDWLGRAYGRRAETANALTAVLLAKKAREAFERAVELNPKNAEALSDLFDYYLAAPAILGGGYDKAEHVAGKMASVDYSEASLEHWKLSQKRRQLQTSE